MYGDVDHHCSWFMTGTLWLGIGVNVVTDSDGPPGSYLLVVLSKLSHDVGCSVTAYGVGSDILSCLYPER